MFETRALQTSPELHAIAPAAYPDGNRCKANPSTSAKIKSRTAEAVLFFKEREVFETRALQTSPELHAIAPTAYPNGNRCKANLSAMYVSPSKSELYVDRECFLIYSHLCRQNPCQN